jgi:hypothetical protein
MFTGTAFDPMEGPSILMDQLYGENRVYEKAYETVMVTGAECCELRRPDPCDSKFYGHSSPTFLNLWL